MNENSNNEKQDLISQLLTNGTGLEQDSKISQSQWYMWAVWSVVLFFISLASFDADGTFSLIVFAISLILAFIAVIKYFSLPKKSHESIEKEYEQALRILSFVIKNWITLTYIAFVVISFVSHFLTTHNDLSDDGHGPVISLILVLPTAFIGLIAGGKFISSRIPCVWYTKSLSTLFVTLIYICLGIAIFLFAIYVAVIDIFTYEPPMRLF